MNPQLIKELRPLLLPWLVAAVAVVMQALSSDYLFGITGFVFCGTAVLLVATTVGAEFHQRTLGLMLTQPCDRARSWQIKLLAAAIAIGSLALLDCRIQAVLKELSSLSWLYLTSLLATIICGTGFWVGRGHSIGLGSWLSLTTNLPLLLVTALPFDAHWRPAAITVALAFPCVYILLGWTFWKPRMLPLATALLGILVFSYVGSLAAEHANSDQGSPALVILTLTFLIATLCSAGFWTLVAQSTIGGIAFTVAIQFGISLAVQAVASKFFQVPIGNGDGRVVLSIALVGLVYSALFLWLGRRKWVNFELRLTHPGESASALPGKLGSMGCLRPQPRGVTLNLFRKELHLQRSLMLLALLFIGCWVVTGVAAFLLPGRGIEQIFQGLYLFYSPICMLLAGSVAMSEETTLGTFPWHLSLPVGPGRQWFVKLITGLSAGLVLAMALPAALAWITSSLPRLETHFAKDLQGHIFVAGWCVALYVLAFWSATMLPGAVRATMTAIASLASLIGLYAVGMPAARGLMFPGPWLASVLLSWFQTSETPMEFTVDQRYWVVFTIAPLTVVILLQSAIEFRRPPPKRFTFCKRALVLGILAIVLPIFSTGVANSINAAFSGMLAELNEAAKLIVERETGAPNNGVRFSALKETGYLSRQTEYWLRNSTFECSRLPIPPPVTPKTTGTNTGSAFVHRYMVRSASSSVNYSLTVTFPGKKTLTTTFSAVPPSPQAPEAQP